MATALKFSMSARDQTNRNPLRLLAVSILFWCAAPGTVMAVDTQFGATVGVGYSDNIRRVEANQVNETIGTVGVDFAVEKNTRRLLVDVMGDLAFFDYLDNTFDREVIGNAIGRANFRIVPDRFEWLFQDNFGQVATDPFAPVTPANRENVNYFSTGPTLNLRLNSQMRLRLMGQYSKVSYETSPLDSSRYMGGAALIHDFSNVSFVSLNVRSEKTRYDSSASTSAADNSRDQAYARYEVSGIRTKLGVDAGYNRLRQTAGDDSGWLARIDLSRRISASATLSVLLGHEFSDASNSFRQQQSVTALSTNTQSLSQTANPFVSEYVTLGWDFARQRTGLGISASYFDEKYRVQQILDQSRTSANVHFSRALAPQLSLQLGATYSHSDFKNTVGDFTEVDGSAALMWRFGRKFWLTFEYDRFDRNSDLLGGDFKENRGWIRLRYGDALTRSSPTSANPISN